MKSELTFREASQWEIDQLLHGLIKLDKCIPSRRFVRNEYGILGEDTGPAWGGDDWDE
jgi:hypothetical protein